MASRISSGSSSETYTPPPPASASPRTFTAVRLSEQAGNSSMISPARRRGIAVLPSRPVLTDAHFMISPFTSRQQIGGEEAIWSLARLCLADGSCDLVARPAGVLQGNGASENDFQIAG